MLLTPELLNRLTPLEIKARQIVEGFISGLHKSPFFGFSVEFAEHRLIDSVLKRRDKSTDAILNGIISDVRAYCNNNLGDDLTLIVCKVL